MKRFVRDVRQLIRAIRSDSKDVSYDELRTTEELHRLLATTAPVIVWTLRFPNVTTYVSPAVETILGLTPEEQLKRPFGLELLTTESAERASRLLQDAVANRAPSITYEAEHHHADGGTVWCEVHQGIVYDDDGAPSTIVGITRDISEERRIRDQLTSAQKAEAVGALAGGVAHDFNNYLTVIIGALELVGERRDKDEEASELLADALDAAERSAAITAQLLAFSRHQPIAFDAIDLNALVRQADALIRRVAGERISVDVVLARGLRLARADENLVHQILVNLTMNSCDAIEGNGWITIETGNVFIDRQLAESRPGVVPGRYTMIAVSDNGSGMTDEVANKATQPFFTTKALGKGTGLGLAMVKSIVERLGGDFSIYSEVGQGTTVKVYLPSVENGTEAVDRRPEPIELERDLLGSERILVVEDEDAVRSIALRILENAGYDTLEAASPTDAIQLLDELARGNRLPDVILTDLVMPDMSGLELAKRVRDIHPSIRWVVMSGYAENGASNVAAAAMPGPLVSKPFHSNGLLRVVRSVLDAPRSEPPARAHH